MNDLVVKHNALINASYMLNLVEQRLILLAIVDARRSGRGITANDPLTIAASDYMHQFDTDKNTAYDALKSASDTLFNRYFTYQDKNKNGNIENVKARWVSEIRYIDNEASVKLIFSSTTIPLITELENRFTQYAIEQISGLSSTYAVRLYELLIQWRSKLETPVFEIHEFREKLGIVKSEYKLMSDFKRRVLDSATDQINERTDIIAKYQQHKAGRKITGFSFTFKFKKKPESKKLTTKAVYTRADLDKNPTLAYPGESHEQALARLNARHSKLGAKEEQTEIDI